MKALLCLILSAFFADLIYGQDTNSLCSKVITHQQLKGTYGVFLKNGDYEEIFLSDSLMYPYMIELEFLIPKAYRFIQNNVIEVLFYVEDEIHYSKHVFKILDDGRLKATIYPSEKFKNDSVDYGTINLFLYPIDESELTIADLFVSETGEFDMSRVNQLNDRFLNRRHELELKRSLIEYNDTIEKIDSLYGSLCQSARDSAQKNAANEEYCYTRSGTIFHDEFEAYFYNYMLKRYNIKLRTSCTGVISEKNWCFFLISNRIVDEKFGENFISEMHNKVKEEFENQKK